MSYITQSGCRTGYEPTNTKWGGTSSLNGILPGGGLRSLGYFRPNFAMARGMYPGGGHAPRFSGLRGGLGDDVSVDPGMLGLGIGALALGMLLFGRKHPKKARRRGRIGRALAELRR